MTGVGGQHFLKCRWDHSLASHTTGAYTRLGLCYSEVRQLIFRSSQLASRSSRPPLPTPDSLHLIADGSQPTAHSPQLTAHNPKLTSHNPKLTAHNSLIAHALICCIVPFYAALWFNMLRCCFNMLRCCFNMPRC